MEIFTRPNGDGVEEDPIRTEHRFEAFIDATSRPLAVVSAVAHEDVGHGAPGNANNGMLGLG